MKITIQITEPILPGSVSTAKSRCGKKSCICWSKKPKLHGTYYRWTGFIDGKRTTKTISKEVALECRKRIHSYNSFKKRIDDVLKMAISDAPWVNSAQIPKQ